MELAALNDSLGQRQAAADALNRAMYVYPLEMGAHRRLAELSAELGDWQRAIRERRAVVALGPVDRAESLYQLARAYFSARDLDQARRSVLRALEIAPGFEEAQELLLEIHDARSTP
jgi:tetratricopeptide (TPR) repeat protein